MTFISNFNPIIPQIASLNDMANMNLQAVLMQLVENLPWTTTLTYSSGGAVAPTPLPESTYTPILFSDVPTMTFNASNQTALATAYPPVLTSTGYIGVQIPISGNHLINYEVGLGPTTIANTGWFAAGLGVWYQRGQVGIIGDLVEVSIGSTCTVGQATGNGFGGNSTGFYSAYLYAGQTYAVFGYQAYQSGSINITGAVLSVIFLGR